MFEFPLPIERIEIETAHPAFRQRSSIVAVAEMTDGRVYATAMEVIVTLAGCMDGT